jgi:hypothetical protein
MPWVDLKISGPEELDRDRLYRTYAHGRWRPVYQDPDTREWIVPVWNGHFNMATQMNRYPLQVWEEPEQLFEDADQITEVMTAKDLLPDTHTLIGTFGVPYIGRRATHAAILAAQKELAKAEKHWRSPDEGEQPVRNPDELRTDRFALERVNAIEHLAGKKYTTLEGAQAALDSIFSEAYAAIEEWPSEIRKVER